MKLNEGSEHPQNPSASRSLESRIETALRMLKRDCRTDFTRILKVVERLASAEQHQELVNKNRSQVLKEIEEAARTGRPCAFNYEKIKAMNGKGEIFWIDPLKSGAISIPIRTKNKSTITLKDHPKGIELTVYFDTPGKGKITIFEEVL